MPLPLAQIDATDPGQQDLDTSAYSVLNNLENSGHESAGLIMQHPNGQYFHTIPIPSAQHDQFAFRAALQKGWKLAAIYHTHPGADTEGQVFSPQDLQTAAQMGIPSYIKFLNDGSIRKYAPGQTKTQDQRIPGSSFTNKVAKGDPVDSSAIRDKLAALKLKAQPVSDSTVASVNP